MPIAFADYTKCNESPVLSERLQICGATNGIDAKPITVQVDLWTGRPQSALQFTIGSVSENAMKDRVRVWKCGTMAIFVIFLYCSVVLFLLLMFSNFWFTLEVPSDPHPVRMNFRVDSPAAWAAEIYNCTLLDRNVSVERSVLESADATCRLLKGCSNETLSKLCRSIADNGFGGQIVYVPGKGTLEHVPPLLPPARGP